MGIVRKLLWLLALASMAAAQGNYDDCDADPTNTPGASSTPAMSSTPTSAWTATPPVLPTETSQTLTSTPTSSQRPAPPSQDGSLPPGTNTSVSTISFSGNGCPQTVAGRGPSADYTGDFAAGMIFKFHNLSAMMRGPGADGSPPSAISQRTQNCQAHLSGTGAPEGWQLSPDAINYQGFAVLDPETTVTFFVTTYWSNDAQNTFTSQQSISNPGAERIARLVNLGTRSELWGPCVGSNTAIGLLNINFRASITSRNATALAYFGQLELPGRIAAQEVTQSVSYKWRQCRGS